MARNGRDRLVDPHARFKTCILKSTFFTHPFFFSDEVSRVKLSIKTHPADDYINANYMPVGLPVLFSKISIDLYVLLWKVCKRKQMVFRVCFHCRGTAPRKSSLLHKVPCQPLCKTSGAWYGKRTFLQLSCWLNVLNRAGYVFLFTLNNNTEWCDYSMIVPQTMHIGGMRMNEYCYIVLCAAPYAI